MSPARILDLEIIVERRVAYELKSLLEGLLLENELSRRGISVRALPEEGKILLL